MPVIAPNKYSAMLWAFEEDADRAASVDRGDTTVNASQSVLDLTVYFIILKLQEPT